MSLITVGAIIMAAALVTAASAVLVGAVVAVTGDISTPYRRRQRAELAEGVTYALALASFVLWVVGIAVALIGVAARVS